MCVCVCVCVFVVVPVIGMSRIFGSVRVKMPLCQPERRVISMSGCMHGEAPKGLGFRVEGLGFRV